MRTRILIADDHGLVAAGLQSLIEANDAFEVVGKAHDGLEAIQSALAHKPDVVLMDMMMPELNGIEATRDICKRCPDTKVIMVSMHSNPEAVYRSIEAGAAGFLVKRSAARELFRAINAVRNGHRFFSAGIAESLIERYVTGQAPTDPLGTLSAREQQVLQLLAEGNAVAQIATALSLSPKTVETYRARLFDKLGIHDLPGLVRFAIQHGVISLD